MPNSIVLVVADESEEFPAALHYATALTRRCGGRVAVLCALGTPEFQHWGGVAEMMEAEQRDQAEAMLLDLVGRAGLPGGADAPVLYVRSGEPADAVRAVLDEEPNITLLVLAGRTRQADSGPLVSHFTGRGLESLRVPVAVVPDTLGPEAIAALTRTGQNGGSAPPSESG
jgi:nucleotide-binding universal stress UspA family protein